MDEFELSGGDAGSWFSDIVGKYFDYRAKTQPQPGIRWLPYGADGTQRGFAPDGSIVTRGTPAAGGGLSQLMGLLPLVILVALAALVYRAWR